MKNNNKIYLGGEFYKAIKKSIVNDDRSYDHFHPSQFAGCSRKIMYYYYHDKDGNKEKFLADIDPDTQRIFDNGHYVHDRYSNYARMTGMLRGWWKCYYCGHTSGKEEKLGIFDPEKSNIPCSECEQCRYTYREVGVYDKEYNFAGHVDAIMDDQKGNIFVVDFKSINLKNFGKLEKPSVTYIVQIFIYMWLLGLDRGIIFYECKDNQRTKEFCFFMDEYPDIISHVRKKAKFLSSLQNQGKMPKRPYKNRNNNECRYCPFIKECWGDIGSLFKV